MRKIFILFLALAFLEDSGYMARVAYVMEGIMSKLGLSGRAFIPMILGIVITLQFVALIGIWHMKRWGVELFIVMFFARLLLFMLLELYGFRFYFNMAYCTIFSFCFLAYYKKMDSNL